MTEVEAPDEADEGLGLGLNSVLSEKKQDNRDIDSNLSQTLLLLHVVAVPYNNKGGFHQLHTHARGKEMYKRQARKSSQPYHISTMTRSGLMYIAAG